MKHCEIFNKGAEEFKKRIDRQKDCYQQVVDAGSDCKEKVFYLKDKNLFYKVMREFVASLDNERAKGDLFDIYTVALHIETGALIVANKGATLFSLTECSGTPVVLRHIGMCVYMPEVGLEYANVGLVGDVYNGKIVLRTESACTPSFLFGSQRCNCYYQWKNVRELSAYFNKISPPKIKDGDEFERWVKTQFVLEGERHVAKYKSKLGFVLLHVDSQNGMGSGVSNGEFVYNLAERASMRHRGEYTSEQIYDQTMWGGFTSIGLDGDPRSESGRAGYKLTPIILDFLNVSRDVIMLSNNPLKLGAMQEFGYNISRVKSIGAVNAAGATEARQRGEEFKHIDIDGALVSFKEDYNRMKKEIKSIIKNEKKGG